jgi:hypothetical protein
LTYYALKFFATIGLIWDLRPVPGKAYDHNQQLS